jgi:NADPH2:quinone reductase
MRAVRVARQGGPEVLEVVDLPDPAPGQGQLLVRVSAAGVNFMDVYARTGMGHYARPTPFVLGTEGAGRVVGVGDGVVGFGEGDRVAWKHAAGSYCEVAVVDAAEAVPIPDAVTDEVAAAVLLQGLTAHYLATSTYPVRAGETVVVHAAAGGVGLLLTQVVKLREGRVIGTVSTAAKEVAARTAGADEVIWYADGPFAPAVRSLTGGEGAAAVYDGVGQATFEGSLASLRPRGYLVLFGAASGPVPPFDLQRLNPAGSLFVTRPTLAHYTRTREELLSRCADLFGWIATGRLDVRIGGRYPLIDAARAHTDIESRSTMGKLLLLPG